MEIAYRRRFSQFVDNYLASYYSAGVQTFQRIAGGPLLVFFGSLAIIFARQDGPGVALRVVLWLLALVLIGYGAAWMLRPFVNIGLVWLRRAEFLGPEGALVRLRLNTEADRIEVQEPDGDFAVPLKDILAIQHRAESAWIVTRSDHMLFVPRRHLVSGDQDAFIAAIERILDEKEQKH